MSWYVRHLLEQSEKIRSTVVQESGDIFDLQTDTDEYADLLSIEMAISTLYESKILSEKEVLILNFIEAGASVDDIVLKMPLSKMTIYNLVKSAGNKIAFYLGDHFTDYGFLDNLSTKFSQDDMEKIRKYMETDIL